MELTTPGLARFIGGQILIQGTGYIYCGDIANAVVEDDKLSVFSSWMARDIRDGLSDYWVYTMHNLNPSFYVDQYEVTDFGPGSEGGNRICLTSIFFNETIILFPSDGIHLDREKIHHSRLDPVTT